MVLNINLGQSSYDVVIEKGALNHVKDLIKPYNKILIVSDNGIPKKYIDNLLNQLPTAISYVFIKGEEHKTFRTYQAIIDLLIEKQFTRKDAIIALGGGLTSDVAGFAASSYMRGIDFYIVPTTLLSQADASIGGKVAINENGIKNIIGAFYQPKKVIIDPNTLLTLEPRLFNEGIAEIVKMAAIYDQELFKMLENCEDFNANIEEILYQSLLIKKDVVEKDEKESNLRSVLNFGHTVGHAIEALGKGKYYHGEAVAIGMLYFCEGEAKTRIQKLLNKYHLPTKDEYSAKELLSLIKVDKKADGNSIKVVEVKEIGKYQLTSISYDELEKRMEAHKNEK